MMIKHYIKTAFRNITRNFGYSLINFVGLSIGITLFILIMLFVVNEYSFDKFNENYNRIYRFEFGDAEMVHLPSAAGLDAQDWFPEIEHVVRFKSIGSQVINYNESTVKIPHVMLADSSFFNVFTTQFIVGDPATAFATPNSMVITEKIAKTLFGNENPINEIVKTPDGQEVVITGVIKEFPNFHIQIDALLPFNLLGVINNKEYLRSYGTWQFQTYFLLPELYDAKGLANKLVDKFKERWPDWEDPLITLRPLQDVYFANHSRYDFGMIHGNKNNVRLFLAIGIFIIFIACINFINLTTARAASRATEVGIRKVHGSTKHQLIVQFLSESVLITFISFLLAITLVQLLLPTFNNLVQKELNLFEFINTPFVVLSVAGILVVGIIAGIYPAFYLTAFNSISVLKGEKTKGKSAVIFRKILVIIQFTISVALIISTLVVHKQLNFLKNKDTGFIKDDVITLGLNTNIKNQKEAFKQKLLSHPEILKVSFSGGKMTSFSNSESFDLNSDGDRTSLQVHVIDPAFLDLYEIELIEGRNFSFDNQSDYQKKIILNEEAVKEEGLEMGKVAGTIFHRDSWYLTALPSKECEIIGVFKSYNYRSLRENIGPQALVWNDDWMGTVNIKIQEGQDKKALEIIETIYKEFSENIPFGYSYVEEEINNLYSSEQRLGRFFQYFAFIAIIIAMLGLFGLAAFIAASRTKEIGIRKALGSSASQIILLISREFIKWVVIANIIAIPIAYYGMNKWLQGFAYKTNITVDIYLYAFLISILIALLTIFYQSLKAARSNPANSLRYE